MAGEIYDDEPSHREKRNRPRQLREFYMPNEYNHRDTIMGPAIEAAHYEIKASVIKMLPLFHGVEDEDPYYHLDEFLDVCGTVRITNIDDDVLKLRLFPFSLKDKAKYWLKSLTSMIRIQSWEELQREFLKKYFPIGKINQFRRAIISFAAYEGESFHQSWERMKELLRRCHYHQVPKWQILQGFYDGLSDSLKQIIDSSCRDSLILMNEDNTWDLFDTLSENSLHNIGPFALRLSERNDVLEVGPAAHLQGQLDALSRKIDQLYVARGASSTQTVCAVCHLPGHDLSKCPYYVPDLAGQVNVAQGFSRPVHDPYLSIYNPGWRNHPNFGWRAGSSGDTHASSGSAPSNMYQNRQHQCQQPSYHQGSSSSTMIDRILKVCEDIKMSQQQSQAKYDCMLQEQSQNFTRYDQTLASYDQDPTSHTQSFPNLENQTGQLASSMNFRQAEPLLSQPINNPKGKGVLRMQDDFDQKWSCVSSPVESAPKSRAPRGSR
ncbi:unnamed protein product [Victoria cruziana]